MSRDDWGQTPKFALVALLECSDGGNDLIFNEIVDATQMVATLGGDVGTRSRHDHKIEIGNDEDELPPISPRVVRRVPGKLTNPEPRPVFPIAAPPRSANADRCLIDPELGDQLAIADAAIVLV